MADPIFQMAASSLRFGPGATEEVGQDLTEYFRCKSVVVFTDRNVRQLPCFQVLLESLERNALHYRVFDNVRVEPSDISFKEAIEYLKRVEGGYDGVVAMGGGSVIDTAKAANLYASHEHASFHDHVNAPTGKGLPVAGPVRPLIAIPTTSGTGSETTGVAIFDDSSTRSKTGIADRHLKPALGIVDPVNTATQPSEVTTFTGLDVLCHAVESYTALPSRKRFPRPSSPLMRPAYQGSNPVADVWSLFAVETTAKHLRSAIDGCDDSRFAMMMASSAAGMGFGNAGVHLCHGMSYTVSSQAPQTCRYYRADHALIPHGLSVAVNAPAVFRFTQSADPERHATCARILGNLEGNLCDAMERFLEKVDVQPGIRQFGYAESDVEALVNGTSQQHRVTKLSPRPVGRHDLEDLFRATLE